MAASVRKSRLVGQAIPEYLVAVLIVSFMLFTPVKSGKSCVELLIESFKNNYQGYEFALSQPVVD